MDYSKHGLFDCNTSGIDSDECHEELLSGGDVTGRGNYITIKFFVEDNILYTQSYHEETAIRDLKVLLVNVFKIPANHMILLFDNLALDDEVTLTALGQKKTSGILEFTLKSTHANDKLLVNDAYRNYTEPDVLTVRVQTISEGIKNVVVEVENRTINKPFLGGYLDKKSGLEYHHGFSQTGPPKPKISSKLKNHRDTQTYFTRNRKLDKEYSQATQMTTDQIWIPNITDKIIVAKTYETADEREKRLAISQKVWIIQRYFRAWLTRKRVKEYSAEYKKRQKCVSEREALEKTNDENRRKYDLINRVFPRTAADFSMLYSMTERWKKAEIRRIISMHCGPARIAEFYLLLEKEIELLRSIEALRMELKNDRAIQKELDFFKIIGDPWTFKSTYNSIPITIDTTETQKGRSFRKLYETVCNTNLNHEERIMVFLDLKQYFSSHNCLVVNDLVQLVDRACELLACGFCMKDIATLQKRIESLLLYHFQSSECNEGVTNRYERLTKKTMQGNLYYCQGCQKLKSIEAFNVNIKSLSIKNCAVCQFIDRSKEPWIDISPYQFILRQIKRSERIFHTYSSIAYILQAKDIYYLVTNIWHAHSALSQSDNIYELRLPRWDKNCEWAPWNCILLTDSEAKMHLKACKLEDIYEKDFLSTVFSKHALAKQYFKQAFDVDRRIKDSDVSEPHVDQYFNGKKLCNNKDE